MGFGMANWVFKQRSRKAFAKRSTKPTSNTSPLYKRQFKLQPSKKSNRLHSIFTWMLIVLVSVGLFVKIPEFMAHSRAIAIQNQERIKRLDAEAFSFLMRAGQAQLMRDDLVAAYHEFLLAQKIKPKDEHLNQLILETLSSLCENENQFCGKLDDAMSKGL
jgi:hypothetical protein